MKRIDPRIIFGLLLILAGGLALAQALGFLQNASDIFWGSIFLVAGGAFLFVFVSGQWWAAIPGLVLAGIGGLILLPDSLEELGGGLFLGAIGLAFWLIYLTGREKWWAIIPGGVLLTLAVIASTSDFIEGIATAGILFGGLALTFLLVALLAGHRWAYWPGAVLGIMAVFFLVPSQMALASYVGAAAMILVGGYLIFSFFRAK